MIIRLTFIVLGCLASAAARPPDPAFRLRFAFGAAGSEGSTSVKATDTYNVNRGYGFDLGSQVRFVAPTRNAAGEPPSGCVTGEGGRPFFFSARVDPGVYRVTLTLGDPVAETVATVKSETRRLMLEAVHVPAGQTKTFTFLTHVRVPQLPDGERVRMKPREIEPILYVQWAPAEKSTLIPFLELDWDEKLTLEFSDAHPALAALEIAPADAHQTVFIAGDSTSTDQMMEPTAAWGQMLPRWFQPPIVIANYAECGSTAAGFIRERRWAKLLSEIQRGDIVLLQFGINDRRMPVEDFKASLRQMVADARTAGATPVVVAPQHLRSGFFDAGGKGRQALGEFPEATRAVAREVDAPCLDLNAMSTTLYEAIGPQQLPNAFVDGTHHSTWGAYLLARCIVQACLDQNLPPAHHVVPDWAKFEPARPFPFAEFRLPPDPQLDPARPGGPGAPDGRGMMAGALPPSPANPPPR